MVSALIHFLSCGSNLPHLWVFGWGNERMCETLCNLTPTSFHSCLWGEKNLPTCHRLCSPQGFVNTLLSDCKTPTLPPHLISSSPHHEPCSTFGSMPCFLNFWWCVGGWSSMQQHSKRGKRSAAFPLWCLLWDYRRVTWGKADGSVWELWSRSPGPDIIFDFLFCLLHAHSFEVISDLHIVTAYFFYFLHLLELQYIHINMRAKQMTSRWSQKPVVLQAEHLNDTSL